MKAGQWRTPNGALVREPSYVVELLHPATPESETRVRQVIDAYKTRFASRAADGHRCPGDVLRLPALATLAASSRRALRVRLLLDTASSRIIARATTTAATAFVRGRP